MQLTDTGLICALLNIKPDDLSANRNLLWQLLETENVTGIEVKASATIQMTDFRGLIKLRDSIGDRFIKAVVFYDGESILSFGDKLFAITYGAFLLK
jgi:hypothetical protein